MGMRAVVLALVVLASCALDPGAAGSSVPDPPGPSGALTPACPPGAAPCTDMYFAAHEDDDLLFMNPDIADSIEQGNHVVVVHLTAGDVTATGLNGLPDRPSSQQYWMDRERGSINAYTFMAEDEAYTAYVPGNVISSHWTASVITVAGVQVAEYDLVQGPQVISLVYLRLSDRQLDDAWSNRLGNGGMAGRDATGGSYAAPLAAGSMQTVPCTGCPLGTDIPAQVITRRQLLSALGELITRFTAGSSYSAVSFQDASGIFIDGTGTPASCNPHGKERGARCGRYDYWDHVYGAMFVLSAAVAARSQDSVLSLREYRGYSISQEPRTLSVCPVGSPWCDSQTTAKTSVMAYYALYDDGLVDHGATGFDITAPSFQKAASLGRHRKYDPRANKPATYDDYDANDPYGWESRQLELRSSSGGGLVRGRLQGDGGCLGFAGTALQPVACAHAPTWDLTAGGQLQLTGTDQCATVVLGDPDGATEREDVVLGPCSLAGEATAMVLFDDGQIRTANAQCLSLTATVSSAVCMNPHDTNPSFYPHAPGSPVPDQTWTVSVQ